MQVSTETDTFGNATNYIRDSNTWVLQEGHTDIVSGITTTTAYTYDTKGNVLTKTEAQGTAIEKTTTYTYHPTFNKVLTETVDSVVDPARTGSSPTPMIPTMAICSRPPKQGFWQLRPLIPTPRRTDMILTAG